MSETTGAAPLSESEEALWREGCEMGETKCWSDAEILRLFATLDAARERADKAEKHKEWAMGKLREMNHDRKAWARELSQASARSPLKPTDHLSPKNPKSVAEWLRYLLHKVRSQAGEVRAYGNLKATLERVEHELSEAEAESSGVSAAVPHLSVRMAAADVQSSAEGIRRSEAEASDESPASRIGEASPPCALCGGPHQFDTSIPSTTWNRVIREAGLPDYLCLSCIVAEFVVSEEQSFTATLFGPHFEGVGVEFRIRALSAAEIAREAT